MVINPREMAVRVTFDFFERFLGVLSVSFIH